MSEITFSIILMPVILFHCILHRAGCRLSFQERQASLWCTDSLYAICGAVGYLFFQDYKTVLYFENFHLFVCSFYLVLFVVFLCAAPSGFRIFAIVPSHDPGLISEAEYRFDRIACMMRNFIYALLLVMLPILLLLHRPMTEIMDIPRLSSSLLIISYLLLPPLCLRQALFWCKSISNY